MTKGNRSIFLSPTTTASLRKGGIALKQPLQGGKGKEKSLSLSKKKDFPIRKVLILREKDPRGSLSKKKFSEREKNPSILAKVVPGGGVFYQEGKSRDQRESLRQGRQSKKEGGAYISPRRIL